MGQEKSLGAVPFLEKHSSLLFLSQIWDKCTVALKNDASPCWCDLINVSTFEEEKEKNIIAEIGLPAK